MVESTIIKTRSGTVVSKGMNSVDAISKLAEKIFLEYHPNTLTPEIKNRIINEIKERIHNMVIKGTYTVEHI